MVRLSAFEFQTCRCPRSLVVRLNFCFICHGIFYAYMLESPHREINCSLKSNLFRSYVAVLNIFYLSVSFFIFLAR